MKKMLLAGALLAMVAWAAEAQVSFEYTRRTRNSSLVVRWGHPLRVGPGLVMPVRDGYFLFGVCHIWPDYRWLHRNPYGFYSVPGYSYYAGPVSPLPDTYRSYTVADYSPVPAPSPVAVVSRKVEEGRARFRARDYRGAVDEFREAVTVDPEDGPALAHFALALAVAGDGRNGDKALRSAAARLPFAAPDLGGLFRDAKERARVLDLMDRRTGGGELTAAYARALAGSPEPLKKLAEKDPAARKLAGP